VVIDGERVRPGDVVRTCPNGSCGHRRYIDTSARSFSQQPYCPECMAISEVAAGGDDYVEGY
jgi:hypothetical protein